MYIMDKVLQIDLFGNQEITIPPIPKFPTNYTGKLTGGKKANFSLLHKLT